MKKLFLTLLLGLFVAGISGCATRPEPVREEILETSEKTIKSDWEEQMPGEDK